MVGCVHRVDDHYIVRRHLHAGKRRRNLRIDRVEELFMVHDISIAFFFWSLSFIAVNSAVNLIDTNYPVQKNHRSTEPHKLPSQTTKTLSIQNLLL